MYLTGVYFFILMYTGSNVQPIAKFLQLTHITQAFRSDEVRKTRNVGMSGWWEDAGGMVRMGVSCACYPIRLPNYAC